MSNAAWILFEAGHMEKPLSLCHCCSAHDTMDHLSANPQSGWRLMLQLFCTLTNKGLESLKSC